MRKACKETKPRSPAENIQEATKRNDLAVEYFAEGKKTEDIMHKKEK